MSTQPLAGYATGEYMGQWTTGVIAAALAVDGALTAIRVGPTQTAQAIQPGQVVAYIKEITLQLSITVAFTAVQQFGFYLARYSGANMTGGTSVTPVKLSSSTIPNSVCQPGGPQAGDLRAATIGALATAGVTVDTAHIPVYGWSVVGPADLGRVVLDFHSEPIRLGLGEGLGLFNAFVWPAAGTALLNGTIKWQEQSFG